MKPSHILKLTLLILSLLGMIYLVFAFTAWSFNPSEWNTLARFMFAVIEGTFLAFIIGWGYLFYEATKK